VIALVGALFAILLLQVLLRYLGVGLVWVEELSIALFIWLVFLGAALAFRRGEHPIVELGFQALSRHAPAAMRGIRLVLAGLICLVLLVLAVGLAAMARQTWQLSSGLVPGFRVGFLYLGVLVAVLLAIWGALSRARSGGAESAERQLPI
jgi:TRAP-type C4-dicarboxylate transport system permease small subunit